MTSIPFDLPTLRKHFSYFTINNKKIPILYRLKSGVYYPYIAFELVVDELDAQCITWNSSKKLPLLSMTLNERLFYKYLCPNQDFLPSSKLILCSIIYQFIQLIKFLKSMKISTKENNQENEYVRFTIDNEYGSIQELDIFNSYATTNYNNLRSTNFPSIQSVKRQLHFDDDKFDFLSIGGYLQLDRCIYPYIISSSDLLLNLNDLRKTFNSSLNILMPYFHAQSRNLINNYIKIVEYGTRYIKKYRYYYKKIDDKFISLNHLLLSHSSLFFIQLFNSKKISLKNLHQYYRSDYSNLLMKNISTSGYLNNYQPCLNEWRLFDLTIDHDKQSRLATEDETILINWLLIYDNKSVHVHYQTNDLILVKSSHENMKSIENEHSRRRAILNKHFS